MYNFIACNLGNHDFVRVEATDDTNFYILLSVDGLVEVEHSDVI